MLVALGCAPQASSTATDTTPTNTTQSPADCAQGKTMTAGKLTIGTDSPAYDPWFRHNDPTNGKGYESAVAYAVAKQLGFDTSAGAAGSKVPFNSSYAPGPKHFDFDINQISITPARAKVVDFSDGYYSAAQAMVAIKGSPVVERDQPGRPEEVQDRRPDRHHLAHRDPRPDPAATASPWSSTTPTTPSRRSLNGQVDAIVADLPTAFYITAAEIPKGTIVGQFQPTTGQPEQFGMLFEKGNPLVACVNQALARHLKSRRHARRRSRRSGSPTRSTCPS